MTKITTKPDCGNSPKIAFVRDFNIAFAEGNKSKLLESVTDDFRWRVYGDFDIQGKQAFSKEIDKMLTHPKAKELIIDSIITHGKEAAANGLIMMESETYAYCDIFKFKSAGSQILVELKSFIVKV